PRPDWPRLITMGPDWPRLIAMGPDWPRLITMGPDRSRMKICSKLAASQFGAARAVICDVL
ncbi:hypothetical protein, partial [Pseudochrobactrum sp. AO18b]|uniref:hypothetical protein n=1 Tax=Pseudochrobactrum sp. AO18b TaxID=1201036 RepID=UPI001AEBD759